MPEVILILNLQPEYLVHFILKLLQEFLVGSSKIGCQVPRVVICKLIGGPDAVGVGSRLPILL